MIPRRRVLVFASVSLVFALAALACSNGEEAAGDPEPIAAAATSTVQPAAGAPSATVAAESQPTPALAPRRRGDGVAQTAVPGHHVHDA